MVITGIIYALITAACWGSISVVSHKIGGSSQNQILGESYGILLFALVYYFIEQPTINLETMLVGVASGMFYCWGQNQQFRGLEALGVSMGMPLSTAAQLVIRGLRLWRMDRSAGLCFRLRGALDFDSWRRVYV